MINYKVKDVLVREMKLLGYDEDNVKKNVQANKHNELTTTYSKQIKYLKGKINVLRYYLIGQKNERSRPIEEKILLNTLSASTEINISQMNTIMTNDFNENFITTSSSLPNRNDSKLIQTLAHFFSENFS